MPSTARLGPREGWLSVILLACVLWAVVHSVYEAGWTDNLDPLVPLAWFGLLVGLAAAKSGLRRGAAYGLGIVLGIEALVLVFGNRMPEGPWEDRLGELFSQIGAWIDTAIWGGNSRDNMMFALVMGALAFSLGFGNAWLVFKAGRGGLAVIIAAALLLLHLSYSYASLNYHFYFLVFTGLLLLVRLELARRQEFWSHQGLVVQGHVVRNVVLTSAAAIVLVIVAAQQGPTDRPVDLFDPVWSRFVDVWQRGQGHVDRLFGGVQGPPVVVVGLAFGNTMQPREGFELGTAPVLKIESPISRYWRTMSYAIYTGQGMVSGDVYGDRFEGDAPLPLPFDAKEAREEVVQKVTVLAQQSNLVFSADSPVRVDVPTLVEWRETQDDPAVVRLANLLRKGQQYTVVSAVSMATEAQLRQAGDAYPPGVQKYLQLPNELPDRVRTRAAEVTASAPDPYDKALAIEAYLRSLPYDTGVPRPPADRDWVDYTLFDAQGGYADSLATAMTVMLRSVGVPARVVTGFAPGQYDENEAAFILYESEAHAWTEVFFPRYGWMPFEPSAIRTLPFRLSDASSASDLPLDGSYYGESPDDFFDEPLYGGSFGDLPPPLPERRDEIWFAGLGIILVLGALAGGVWFGAGLLLRRGLTGLPWHVRWYGQFRRLAAWAGLAGRESQTPFEYADWLAAKYPGTRTMVQPIAEVYVEGLYSGHEPGPEQLARASRAWDEVRKPLARRVFLRWIISARERLVAARARLPRWRGAA